jgi:hypothetical protein
MVTLSGVESAAVGSDGRPGAWVKTRLADFDSTSLLERLGQLAIGAAGAGFARQFSDQTTAWQVELELLDRTARELKRLDPTSSD